MEIPLPSPVEISASERKNLELFTPDAEASSVSISQLGVQAVLNEVLI